MKVQTILPIAALTVLATSAQATVLFYDDFESYELGSEINGQGGWTANASYTITTFSYNGTQAVHSGNNVADAAISNTFAAQSDGTTIYMGADVDFRPGAANTYFFNLSDSASRDNSAGANYLSSGVRARNFDGSGGSSVGSINTYGDPTRVVVEVSASGGLGTNYDTVKIYSLLDGYTSVISTVVYDTGISSLDTIFGARGSDTNGNSFVFDNLVIATTFAEAQMTIPEPSTYAALAGVGALGLAMFLRRRKR
ncbi:PEP-CTERM sorting domain-containing protein [Cerasicoccus maritimus]|uniref:PEP-CTERM sorting domain-containing protein n=1 Tax=Cerasicoccus maritimus TaxID=490089 RepID=UPI002852A17E|nr:PEP-CTERM sorting domain-containing protein [Cerasicoccus maritimus]